MLVKRLFYLGRMSNLFLFFISRANVSLKFNYLVGLLTNLREGLGKKLYFSNGVKGGKWGKVKSDFS